MTKVKPIDKLNNCNSINWQKVEREVFRLQKRIYRASQRGNVKLVHSLQRLLIKSYYAKLLSIRKVRHDHQDKKIAKQDRVKSLWLKQSLEMVKNLKLRGKCTSTARVKPKGDTESLIIPSLEDKVKQCLVNLAIEPQWEAKFQPNCYEFRSTQSSQEAISAIFNAIRFDPKFVLKANIAKSFSTVECDKLLTKIETYPQLRREIKSWLKSGFMDGKQLFSTHKGTSREILISPLLIDIALQGMEIEMTKFAQTWEGNQTNKEDSLRIIRYADDFVILHKDIEVIIKCKEIMENWLANFGLELKSCKTLISHTLHEYEGNTGFDFLGFNIRQYEERKKPMGSSIESSSRGFNTIIKPSSDEVKAHLQKIGKVIDKHKSSPQVALIKELNPIIKEWSNYYSTVCSKQTYSYCDAILFQQLSRWAKRRHPRKSKTWIAKKYWHTQDLKTRVFSIKDEDGISLMKHRKTKIKGENSLEMMTRHRSGIRKHPDV